MNKFYKKIKEIILEPTISIKRINKYILPKNCKIIISSNEHIK